jgi:pyruvate kinase
MPTTEKAIKTLEDVLALREFVSQTHINPEGCKNPKSLINMHHYLKLRQKDNVELQDELTKMGLSSLGRSQAHILRSLDLIVELLSKCQSREYEQSQQILTIDEAEELMAKRAAMFGGEPKPKKRAETKIMLTLPSDAAKNPAMIEEFANAGVGIFRINTAHDGSLEWGIMAAKIAELNQNLHPQNKLKVYVDLAGPKIRTGKIRKVKAELKLEPQKKIYITHKNDNNEFVKVPSDAYNLEVDGDFYKKAKKEKELTIYTWNEKPKTMEVLFCEKGFIVCELSKKVKVNDQSTICIAKKKKMLESKILNLPEQTEEIRLFEDDLLFLSLEEIEGHSKITDETGKVLKPAAIFCTQKEFVKDAKVGNKVFVDDGKIGLQVLEKKPDGLLCKVINVKLKGETLKEEKGINFPDSTTLVDAITKEDEKNLDSVVEFADILGVSFAQSERDIIALKDLLKIKNKEHIAIVAKIETKLAVKNLPSILEALMYHENSAIMIARGDLAIEVEFENMSYLQEEILDLCEAAHTPVIFATQVLENQMKNNLPSRAEITDAAFAQRADCVMLNKGQFALNTIKKLEFILARMHTIFKKNRLLLGECDIWTK